MLFSLIYRRLLICSCLTNREQPVLGNGATSESLSGVPQGLALEPILFLIYIYGVTSTPLSDGSKMTICYRTETPQDYQKLQNDISSIMEWISVNHLHFNVSECNIHAYKRNPLQRLVLSLCGQVLDQVECFKYLGVLLTYNLTWSIC